MSKEQPCVPPGLPAEQLTVAIDFRSMACWTDDGKDACLRLLAIGEFPSLNRVCINGKVCNIGNFELYGELLTFDATPIDGGSQHG
jgi:hypothetical protein